MYHFRMRGIIKNDKKQQAYEVLYKHGKLYGDKTLIQTLKSKTSEITDPRIIIISMIEICNHGKIWGDYPDLLPLSEGNKG